MYRKTKEKRLRSHQASTVGQSLLRVTQLFLPLKANPERRIILDASGAESAPRPGQNTQIYKHPATESHTAEAPRSVRRTGTHHGDLYKAFL